MSTYIDIHVLQTVPPSNVNRDDTGAPKSAVYGGARRARVSSQAWKRATRKQFRAELDPSGVGYRTKQVAELISDRIHTLRSEMPPEERADRAHAVLGALGLKMEKAQPKKPKQGSPEQEKPLSPYGTSQYLTFFSSDQLDQLAELAVTEDKPTKKQARAKADTNHGIAVSLFGRMVADDTSLNVDASVQVAHALSTHAVDTEADYYTAVDDVSDANEEREDSGAGMIGTIEFNSSTLYRYATINVDQLVANLGDAEVAARATEVFLRGFVTSMPTGKQNTFANGTLPDAVVVMVRTIPVNLVGAFEKPVVSNREGYVRASSEALAEFAQDLDEAYGMPAAQTWVVAAGDRTAALRELGEKVSLNDLGGLAAQIAREAITEDSA